MDEASGDGPRVYPPPGGYGVAGGNGRLVSCLGACVVTCYGEPECLARLFTTSEAFADPILLDRQLIAAKWQVAHNAKGKVFRCPDHALDLSTHVPLVYRGPKESPGRPGRGADDLSSRGADGGRAGSDRKCK